MRRSWVSPTRELSISRQCGLLGLSRASFYYEPAGETAENLAIMRLLDAEYTRHPFYGSRRMAAWLGTQGYSVNRKRAQRLMRLMGLEAIYPKPRLSVASKEHEKYPYLLTNVNIVRPNQVWSTDITYIRLREGFIYLVAVIDWYKPLRAGVGDIEHAGFGFLRPPRLTQHYKRGAQKSSIPTKDASLRAGCSRSTSRTAVSPSVWTAVVAHWITFSSSACGSSLKYEEVYIKDYDDVPCAVRSLGAYLRFYNHTRLHQALNYRTPHAVHHAEGAEGAAQGGQ